MIILPKATWEEMSSAAKQGASCTIEELIAMLDQPTTQPLLITVQLAYFRFGFSLSQRRDFQDWFFRQEPYFVARDSAAKTAEYLRQLRSLWDKRDIEGARQLWAQVPGESAMFIYRHPAFRDLLALQ